MKTISIRINDEYHELKLKKIIGALAVVENYGDYHSHFSRYKGYTIIHLPTMQKMLPSGMDLLRNCIKKAEQFIEILDFSKITSPSDMKDLPVDTRQKLEDIYYNRGIYAV